MESTPLLKLDDSVLETVVELLNYSSMDSFSEDVRKIRQWMMKQPHFPEVMVSRVSKKRKVFLNMGSTCLLEADNDVLRQVVKLLNYSSIESFNEDVGKIKEWIKKQPQFPEVMVDKKIKNFLILNKGSVEKSKEKIENYYTVRSQLPEIFDNIHPKLSYMETVKASIYFIPLPKLTNEMYRILFYKVRDPHLTENFEPVHGIRLLVNIQEIRMTEDITYGDVFILDGKNTPLRSILKVTPMVLYKALNVIYTQVFSQRLKAVYIINAPPYAEKLFNAFKSLLKPKLIERIHFCEDSHILTEKFGKEIIPADYGGSEKSLEVLQEMLYQKFKESEDYFTQLDKLRINDDLKPRRLINDEMFGLSGNFKKLEID